LLQFCNQYTDVWKRYKSGEIGCPDFGGKIMIVKEVAFEVWNGFRTPRTGFSCTLL
jgi:hypothetical protein